MRLSKTLNSEKKLPKEIFLKLNVKLHKKHGNKRVIEDRFRKNLFMTIVPKEDKIKVLMNKQKPKDWSGLNIYFLGFDSLSQMAFRRNLPKTTKFLEETMGAVVLNGKLLLFKT